MIDIAIITTALDLINEVLPIVGGTSTGAAKIVASLESLIPVIVQEFEDLVPEVQNIIAALVATGGATDADLATLQKLHQQVDPAFDAAVEAAEAADAAAAAPTTESVVTDPASASTEASAS